MGNIIIYTLFIGIILFFVGRFLYKIYGEMEYAKHEQSQWQEYAQQHNYTFETSVSDFPYQHKFSFLLNLQSTRIKNVITAEIKGKSVAIAHLTRQATSKKHGPYYLRRTVCLLENLGVSLPEFSLDYRQKEEKPKGLKGAIMKKMDESRVDISFCDDPAFTDVYYLAGDEKNQIINLFDEQVRAYFVTNQKELEHIHIESNGKGLFFTYHTYINHENIEQFIDRCFSITNLLIKK